jgi:hypothetical protein
MLIENLLLFFFILLLGIAYGFWGMKGPWQAMTMFGRVWCLIPRIVDFSFMRIETLKWLRLSLIP